MKINTLAAAVRIGIQANASRSDNRPHIAPVMQLRPLADASAYELLIYGDIGESWWGESVTARSVVDQLNALDATVQTINVRINSYGGSVSDGLAIYNALKRHAARKVVTVDGVAMSSGSLIAMAGDEVQMPATSMLMIHAPWGGAYGNAKELRQYADVLDTFAEAMAGAYTSKSGMSRDDVLSLLTDGDDHYYTGEEAVAAGFADSLISVTDDQGEPDEQARAFASGLLQRHLTRAPEDVAQLAIAASLRSRVPASREANPTASPASNGDDLMSYLARARKRLQNRATESNNGGGGSNQTPAAPAPTASDVAAAALAAVRERNDQIHAALKDVMAHHGVRDLYERALRDPSMSVESVQAQALTLLGAQAQPTNGGGGRVEGGEDESQKFIQGASRALLSRAGVEQRESGNEFNGMTLDALAAHSLVRAGVSVRGMSRDEVARKVLAAHSTSDFPLLLSNVAGRELRRAYEAHPNTFQQWCAISSVSDFKAHPRVQLGSFNSLDTIPEGGDYKYGSVSEEGESITAVTKGKAIKLTRQMLVNDDLGGFLRRAQMLGRAAARTVNADAYGLLTSGASNNGPTMSDGVQLFHASHGNLLSAAAVTTASIAAARAAMRKQKDKDGRDTLNIIPRFLIAPVAIEDVVWAVLNSTADPSSSNSAKRNYARDVAQLTLITDPFLDGVSATGWYLAADPMDAPLVEVAFLDGQQTPFIDEDIDFDSDALKLKVRLDYGVGPIDFRAGTKNPGQ